MRRVGQPPGHDVGVIFQNDAAVKVVAVAHGSPLVTCKRRKDAGTVEFICGARHVSPNGALKLRGVLVSLRVWVVDTQDELENGVSVAHVNGALFHCLFGDALSVLFLPRCPNEVAINLGS